MRRPMRWVVRGWIASLLLTAGAAPARADGPGGAGSIDEVARAGPFHPTWESLEGYRVPAWYLDAKFGIFVHWGAYAVPAFGSEWYPRNMYRAGTPEFEHHVATYGPHAEFGYKDFIPRFTAEKFDPAAWAALFREAGARYVVPVAEHHDGFPMYDCSFTDWDAVAMGPRRDVIGALAAAVRAEGLRFGVSSHRAFNWAYYPRRPDFDTVDPANFGLYGRPQDFLFAQTPPNDRWPPQDRAFMEDWLARTCEVVDRYRPDLVWFDFGITPDRSLPHDQNPNAEHLRRFAAYYYNRAAARGQEPVINYKFRAFPERAAVLDLERSKMDRIREPFWQTDTAVATSSWGFIAGQRYKPVDRLVDDLVDIVSKNGCLLLNVGPRPDGTIPQAEQEMLRAIGRWLALNGEAIYGTRPWRMYGEGPTGTATGHLSEARNPAFTAQDIRFTTRDGTLYAIALGWPEDRIVEIRALGSRGKHAPREVSAITLLGHDGPLEFEQRDEVLRILLPPRPPCDHAFVFRITAR